MNRFSENDLNELIKLTQEQIENMSYETAMEKLQMVVEALEEESTPLETGLKLYELGTNLSNKCGEILNKTEEKMVKLVGDIENYTEQPYDPEKDGR